MGGTLAGRTIMRATLPQESPRFMDGIEELVAVAPRRLGLGPVGRNSNILDDMPPHGNCLSSKFQVLRRLPTLLPVSLAPTITMSARNQVASPSNSRFQEIFNVALSEYQRVTGQDLEIHPLPAAFNPSNSPDAILGYFGIRHRLSIDLGGATTT
jgi:hypothetical protein